MPDALPPPAVTNMDSKEASRPWYKRRLLWGVAAGALWILLFGGGILIDSADYRNALGWRPEPEPSAEKAAPDAKPLPEVVHLEAGRQEIRGRWVIHNFLAALAFYTPTNLVLLALLSGFIGGCASNLSDRRHLDDELFAAESGGDERQVRAVKRRIYYLSEHPLSSMMRSFVVYLVLISGLYVLSSNPFDAESQIQGLTQYMRLAGLMSLLGFIVGYDPTRFEYWLKLIPSPGQEPPVNNPIIVKGNVEGDVTQKGTVEVAKDTERKAQEQEPEKVAPVPKQE